VKNFDELLASIALAGQCTLRQRASLPRASGIYFVTNEHNHLLYIGKAANLQSRWVGIGHHRYKQLARKGLDKITLSYVLAPVAQLDILERQYIEALKPLLNNGRVQKYLPKKSPRLSELQRLLKLVSTPLFPSATMKIDREGNTVPRPVWELFRGFIAGTYIASSIPHVVIICQQNMGDILVKSSTHKTKKRFYIGDEEYSKNYAGRYYTGMFQPVGKFDAEQAVFEFVEFFSTGDCLFEKFYPYLEQCQIVGVKLRKLTDTACIDPFLQNWSTEYDQLALNYILAVSADLQSLSSKFVLDEKKFR
jgi:hypothetical protein